MNQDSVPDSNDMPGERIPLIPRERALDEFKSLLAADAVERVLHVYGDGGRGKTWFLKEIQTECRDRGLHYNRQIIDFYDTAHHRVSGLIASIIRELDPEHRFFDDYFQLRAEFDRLRAQGYGGRALAPLGTKMDCAFLRGLRDLGQYYRQPDGSPGMVLLLDTFEVVREGRVGRWVLEKLLGAMEDQDLCSRGQETAPIVATQDIIVILAGRPPKISQEQTPARLRYCEPGDFFAQEVRQYVQEVLRSYQDVNLHAESVQQLADWIYDNTKGHPVKVALALDLANLHITTYGRPTLTSGGLLHVLQEVDKRAAKVGMATALIEEIMELLGTVPEQQWAVLYMAHLRRRFTPRMCAQLMGKFPTTSLGPGAILSPFEKLYMTKYRHLQSAFRLLSKEARHFEDVTVSLHDLVRDWVYERYWEGSIPLSFVIQARRAGILPDDLDALWKEIEDGRDEIPAADLQRIRGWLDDQAIKFYRDRRQELERQQKKVNKDTDATSWVEYEYQQHALTAEGLLYEMDRDLEEGWRRWRQEYYEAFEAYQQGYCEQLELTILSAWEPADLDPRSREHEIQAMVHVRQMWWEIQHSGARRAQAIKHLQNTLREYSPLPGGELVELQADIHNALGWAYDLEGRLRTSLWHREQAALLLNRLDRDWNRAMVLDFLGWSYHLAGRFSRADGVWQEALHIARRIGDRYRIASVAMKWGYSFNVRGDISRALGYGQVAVRLLRSLGDERSLGLAFNYLSRIYIAQGKFHRAERGLEQAQTYTDRFGEPADQIRLLQSWGEFYRRRAQSGEYAQAGDFDRAEEILRDALRQAQQEKLGQWETEVQEELGALYRDRARGVYKGDPDRAKDWWADAKRELRAALDKYKQGGSFFKVADLLDDLCEMYETQHAEKVNGRSKLEHYLAELDAVATEHHFPRYRSRVAEMRARLAWEEGLYQEAVRHYVDACAYAGLHTHAGETYRSSYDRLIGELEKNLVKLPADADRVQFARQALQWWGRTDQVAAHPQFTQACYRVIYPAQSRLDEGEGDRLFEKGRLAYELGGNEQAARSFERAFHLYIRACDQIGRLTDASYENYLQYMALVSKLERRFYDLPDMDLAALLSTWAASEWQRLEQAVRHPAVLEVCRRVGQMADLVRSVAGRM